VRLRNGQLALVAVPTLFLQQLGHSLTLVGQFEQRISHVIIADKRSGATIVHGTGAKLPRIAVVHYC
jgi:hypothetical protein